jgi:hypothetical protein
MAASGLVEKVAVALVLTTKAQQEVEQQAQSILVEVAVVFMILLVHQALVVQES